MACAFDSEVFAHRRLCLLGVTCIFTLLPLCTRTKKPRYERIERGSGEVQYQLDIIAGSAA